MTAPLRPWLRDLTLELYMLGAYDTARSVSRLAASFDPPPPPPRSDSSPGVYVRGHWFMRSEIERMRTLRRVEKRTCVEIAASFGIDARTASEVTK